MFKKVRIVILLVVLVIVSGNAWLTGIRSTDWDTPLETVIYPVNGDGSPVTSAYIEALDILNFIELRDESNRKNIYITEYGAEALTMLVSDKNFKTRKSGYLEVSR